MNAQPQDLKVFVSTRESTLAVSYWALSRKAESDAALKELEEERSQDDASGIATVRTAENLTPRANGSTAPFACINRR